MLTPAAEGVVSQHDLLRRNLRHVGSELAIDMSPQFIGAYGGMHGGHLAATVSGALTLHAASGHRLLSLTVRFLRQVRVGVATLQVEAEHKGRKCSSFSIELLQGRLAVTGSAVFGDDTVPVSRADTSGLDVVSFHECTPQKSGPSQRLGIEVRPVVPSRDHFTRVCWMRMRDNLPLDESRLMILADGIMPVAADLLPSGLVAPTVEMVVHVVDVAAAKESPWVLGVFRDRGVQGSWTVEDCELFTPGGVLVLVCRQLRHIHFV